MALQTEPLAPTFNQADFTCGKDPLDNYLKTQAKQDIKNRLATTFILPDGKNIIGYYSLSASSIPREFIPEEITRKLGRYPNFPVTLLGRLAVANKYKGQGLGKVLLIDALIRSFLVSKTVASFAVVVDPLDQDAVSFYERHEFIALENGKMFMSMKTIEQLVSEIDT